MKNKKYYYFFLVVFILCFLSTKNAFSLSEEVSYYLKKAEEASSHHDLKKAQQEATRALHALPQKSINSKERILITDMLNDFSLASIESLVSQKKWKQAEQELHFFLQNNNNFNKKEINSLIIKIHESHNNSPKENLTSQKNETLSQEITRNQLLLDVEKNWKVVSPSLLSSLPVNTEEKEQEIIEISILTKKLHSLIIPVINLEDVSLAEAIDYFKEKILEADPLKKGINIFYPGANLEPSSLLTNINTSFDYSKEERHLTLELHDIPLYEALEYLAKQTGLQMRIDPYAVSLLLPPDSNELLVTQEYEIPSYFIPLKEKEASPFSTQEATVIASSRLPYYFSAQEYLESQGIDFKKGASAIYFPSSNKLLVHNTQENIDMITVLVKAACKTPPLQIAIETKFIEINQHDLTELGFNWLLGPFEIGNSGLEASGGGSTTGLNTTAYPFSTKGMNPVGALRSGSESITDASIDSMITSTPNNNTAARSAPGIFSIGGIYSTPQFQMVLRALHQKKGVDLMAAPRITTRNGRKATIKIVDEFIYPSQYSAPQLPLSTTNSNGRAPHQPPPTITPAFPNSWITKNLGVILEAKPTIAADGKTIELELHPQITDFDGFINYGTPINTVGYNFSATNLSRVPFSETLTTNTINQPVFTVREVTTSVMVEDGQTIAIGGLIREDTQHVEDKVPFLGDIPLAGRLFRTKADRKAKKNLIIFVTPHILNSNGAPLH